MAIPTLRPRPRGSRFIDPEEAVEHAGQSGRGYSDAGIADLQHAAIFDVQDAQ